MKSNVIDVKNNTVESLELPDDYFAREVKKHLIYEAVQRYLANRRRGTADTKERGDVSTAPRKLDPRKDLVVQDKVQELLTYGRVGLLHLDHIPETSQRR